MIKKIHRIWFGPAPMPENYYQFGQAFAYMNPGWEVIDWTEEMVLDSGIINSGVWNHLGTPGPGETINEVALATQRADVVGYELVYRYGGLYLNTDIEPVKPLGVLFDNNPALYEKAGAGYEIDQWVVNAAMWAPDIGNEFWGRVIEALPARYYSMPGAYMNATTGPHLLTQTYHDYPHLLHVFHKDTFNPIYFPEVAYGEDAIFDIDLLPEITVGVHHWGHRKNMRPQTAKV
jgi:mannosyltransferase OCH1-like enzyme